MRTIVVAILVLLVLIVVAIIFVGGVEEARKILFGLGECEAQGEGASCIRYDESCPGIKMKIGCEEGEMCCVPKVEE